MGRASYALVGRFDSPELLRHGALALGRSGYRHLDAYSPMPVEGLAEALHLPPSRLPRLVLAGGLSGALLGGGLQYWASVLHYPHVVSGRPFFAWPSFFPVLFEFTILFAALAAVFGMLVANGLPRLHHPIFDAPGFQRASTDGFFLVVKASDPHFDLEHTRQALERAGAFDVVPVPATSGVGR